MLKNKVRIDKFLWCVRFYKSRTLSKIACNKSKVKIYLWRFTYSQKLSSEIHLK